MTDAQMNRIAGHAAISMLVLRKMARDCNVVVLDRATATSLVHMLDGLLNAVDDLRAVAIVNDSAFVDLAP